MTRMPNRFLPFALAALVLGGCAHKEAGEPAPSSPLAEDQSRIVGIWAMLPLRNGIANVAEYRADGKVLLHPFNCTKLDERREIETSDYRVADDGGSIHVRSPFDEFDLRVLDFKPQAMRLGMRIASAELTFDYLKVDRVASLCGMYNTDAERGRLTPYRSGDFLPAPAIPPHVGLERYIGRWANDDGVQLEVLRDSDGGARLYMADSDNWRHLYNDVRWVGDELHFRSYAYTEKPALFSHPYHKTSTATILRPLADGTMQMSFFIGKRRHDFQVRRAQD
ncbi:TPA: hypothetical protein L6B08_08430 [Pseudomonas aeruginosa]|nr:hypothetical protein [Pseudomonas aeruginosa]HBP6819937.1 hypothetical protein [Pseudomonas aeruginosa]